ncbi:hypothetical protein KEM55_005754 [Ascosphaera atra]|nr:hypothetical protein KEM55_005754 [Ascosphaera atra]
MALVDSVQSALRNGTEVQKKAQTKRSSQIQTSGALVSVIQLALRNGTEALARFGRLERVRTVESKASSQSVRLTETPPPDTPLCDRCHNLTKHGVASPIPSPPLSYIRGLLERSPYPYNHVYHVIDAADFPLTVIPNLYRQLNLQEQRSRNRRSKTTTYESGRRKPTVSFIITRSDLLAATEEKVNALMPYITRLLRDRLNIDGEHARMGNVHMVSAHRGWWTRVIKEQVRDHAGGVWMVGKANVGKSSLLSVIFPKLHAAAKESSSPKAKDEIVLPLLAQYNPHELLPDSLLPPPQPVMKYPIFPIVSSTPGTTASPVRIPLTHKRGEIIDLPGLARRGLDEYVEENHIKDLVMKSRIKAERSAIKPGQSMLLGGLIRITPLDPDVTILAAPFVNLPWHIAASEKTTSLQRQERIVPETIIAKKGIQDCFASAGVFELDDDVTRYYGQWKKYGQSLPYRVLGKDILIQGCGWVELNIQVRRKQLEAGFIPKVEVFSPEGDFVGSRPSMCAYANELEKLQKTQRRNRSRPRQSMRRVRLTSRGPFNR